MKKEEKYDRQYIYIFYKPEFQLTARVYFDKLLKQYDKMFFGCGKVTVIGGLYGGSTVGEYCCYSGVNAAELFAYWEFDKEKAVLEILTQKLDSYLLAEEFELRFK